MTESILRAGHHYFRQPDGSWLRYNEAAAAWEPSAPPPPPDPPPPGATGAPPPTAAGAPATSPAAYQGDVYRGSGATAAAREIEGGAAPSYEWRATVSARPAGGFGGTPLTTTAPGIPLRTVATVGVAILVLAVAGWFGYKQFFGPKTFSGRGVSFQYPNGWVEEEAQADFVGTMGLEWAVGLAPDEDPPQAGVIAGRLGTRFVQGAIDINRLETAVRENLSRLTRGTGMTFGRTRVTKVGGIDSVTTSLTGPFAEGSARLKLFVLPDPAQGDVYLLGCLIGSANRAEATDACNLMTDTFELETA
ncbi:MAG: hypothetical protein ABR505_00485 [Actinomycetota bacterium]